MVSPSAPPCLAKAVRTSPAVRLRLSVSASTMIATPPGHSPRSAPLVILAAGLAGRLLDGAVDRVLAACSAFSAAVDRRAQARVRGRVRQPLPRRHGDLADQPRELRARLASCAPLRCMTFLTCEWPAMAPLLGID